MTHDNIFLNKAATLIEALPYMRRYNDSTFVVKYGGHAMGDESLASDFANDIALLSQVGINPVVVHGGGPQIGDMLKRLAIKSRFVDGLRVTDRETVEIVEMVLAGKLNKEIVNRIIRAGANAAGLSGKDASLMCAKKLTRTTVDPESNIEKIVDLEFVGTPETVNPGILHTLVQAKTVPVIAPVAAGKDGNTYNINADTAAGAIAGAMKATRLFMLTDVPGILDKQGELLTNLSVAEAKELIRNKTVTDGMIPKVETCIKAVEDGCESAVILNGKQPHAVLIEMFTDKGAGTLIHNKP